jgi:hypothetical protein
MQSLQVELLWGLLRNCFEIGAQRGFGGGLSILVIVLLSLVEGLHLDCRMIRGSNPMLLLRYSV